MKKPTIRGPAWKFRRDPVRKSEAFYAQMAWIACYPVIKEPKYR